MDEYLVTHKFTCPTCKGETHVHNERWEGAYQAMREAEDKARASIDWDAITSQDAHYDAQEKVNDAGWKAIANYWREQGYYLQSHWPSEDYPCPDCEGTGINHEEIPLAEALAAIGP